MGQAQAYVCPWGSVTVIALTASGRRAGKKVVKADGRDPAKVVRRSRATGTTRAVVKTPPKEATVRKSGRLGRLATALTGLPIEMLSEVRPRTRHGTAGQLADTRLC